MPSSPFTLYFTNPIDLSTFDKSLFEWDKTPGTVTYTPYQNYITIGNQSKAKSSYKITVSRKLKDIYGQSLEDDNTMTFTTNRGTATLCMCVWFILC